MQKEVDVGDAEEEEENEPHLRMKSKIRL